MPRPKSLENLFENISTNPSSDDSTVNQKALYYLANLEVITRGLLSDKKLKKQKNLDEQLNDDPDIIVNLLAEWLTVYFSKLEFPNEKSNNAIEKIGQALKSNAFDARHGERSEGAYSAVGSDFLPSVSDCKKSLRAVKSFESPCVVEP